VGVVVTVMALGAQWGLHQSYFRVQTVNVVGARHESAAAVVAASGLATHPAMIDVNDQAVARDLHHFAWIQSVNVTQHWPHTVVITIHEATAVAVAFTSAHVLEYVSAQGRALGPAPLAANDPTLVYDHPTSTTWPFAKAGRAAAYVASELPVAFSRQVSRIDVNASGQVSLTLTTPVTFELGPATNLHAKFVAIASVIAHSTLVPGDVVDVTVPEEVAVTPPTSTTTTTTPTKAATT